MQDNTTTPSTTERPKRLVKRYSNRKLYDTRESRYVTLLQIADMIRAGDEVQVVDNTTKEDLTEVTFAQIIYEQQKMHNRIPLSTLRDLIHERSERLITQLRESPLGRLLPKEDVHNEGESPSAESGEPLPLETDTSNVLPIKEEKPLEKKGLLEQIDEQIRAALASFSPIQQLQAEVSRLEARIVELEAKMQKPEDRNNS